MPTCNTYEVNSDKIVLESGTKNTTNLSGLKGGIEGEMSVTADKTKTLTGTKLVNILSGTKYDTLSGTKSIEELGGKKDNVILYGSTDKNVSLLGYACEGTWHVRADSTYITADNTLITVDDSG